MTKRKTDKPAPYSYSIRECQFIVTKLACQLGTRHLWYRGERMVAIEDAERIIELVKYAASLDGDESYLKNYEQDDGTAD